MLRANAHIHTMNTSAIKTRLSATITTQEQARAVAMALGVDPARVAWQPRLDLTLHSLAQRLEGQRDLAALLDTALEIVVRCGGTARVASNDPIARHLGPVGLDLAVGARLEALLETWPPSSKLPSLAELAAIVGGTPEQVEALLAAGALEGA